jgi:hypothetical protein
VSEKARRNRKRSQRRQIFCPIHDCYLDSVSQKHSIHADRTEHLRAAGFGRATATMLMAEYTTVPLAGQWLERFWCEDCGTAEWYRVERYQKDGQGAARYHLALADRELWERVAGVTHPDGNPSVGEFTRRQAKARSMTKDFGFVV